MSRHIPIIKADRWFRAQCHKALRRMVRDMDAGCAYQMALARYNADLKRLVASWREARTKCAQTWRQDFGCEQ